MCFTGKSFCPDQIKQESERREREGERERGRESKRWEIN